MRLSIIVPAHNERKRIPPMLDAYLAYFNPRYEQQVEFIVVVNGSVDGTEQVIEDYIRENEQVKMVVIPELVGKGGALLRGFHEARGALVGFVDADGAWSAEFFDELVQGIGDAGANIASRKLDGAQRMSDQPWARQFASRCFTLLVRICFGLKVKDTQCGCKVMKREVIDAVQDQITSYHWTFDVDLLFHIQRAGYTIRETPGRWKHIEGSKIRVLTSSIEMAASVIRLRLKYSPFAFVVRMFDALYGRRMWHRRIMRGRMVQREQLRAANPEASE